MEELEIDSLPPADRLRATFDTARHKTVVVLPPEPGVVTASYGVKGITAIMQPASRPPAALPDLQLDFLVLSPAARPPEERIVRFRLDNADSITAGPGMAVSAPAGGEGGELSGRAGACIRFDHTARPDSAAPGQDGARYAGRHRVSGD